ncbi:MAG: fibronectin type III domain-containing protein [Proteobacteria bacterium]|nr:fibronectin type III domain-containing protein [Pseudomonadota bacterium]
MRFHKNYCFFIGVLMIFPLFACGGGKNNTAVPAAPASLAAAAVSTTQIDLSWQDNSSDEKGFQLERKTGGGAYALLASLSLDATSYSDAGLTPDTSYTYRVNAFNHGGNSAYSNEVTAQTLSNLPAAPAGLSAAAVPGHQINLSWSAGSSNQDGFEVEHKAGDTGTYVSLGTLGAGVLTFSDLNLTPGVDYYYRVRAYNTYGNSGYSGEASARALEPALQISAGGFHTCALFAGGKVECWGDNSYGQIGNGTTTTAFVPVQVSGLSEEVTAISAGYSHTCVLTRAGGVKCWGINDSGQLGLGEISGPEYCTDSMPCSRFPREVQNLSSVIAMISAGAFHTCALTGGGGLKCWGDNAFGQVGDGTTKPRGFPVDVSGLVSGIVNFSSGGYHNCAVTGGGAVKCWGLNDFGQLGMDPTSGPELVTSYQDGTPYQYSYSSTPITVQGFPSDFTTVAAVTAGGMHSCALNYMGAVQCWGRNFYGQLGNGSYNEYIPSPVCVGMSLCTGGMQSISAGNNHTCAVTTGGALKCWGEGDFGQIGNGDTLNYYDPQPVANVASGVTSVSAGGNHTCALMEGGWARCWGLNLSGQLGDGAQEELQDTPVRVFGIGP